MTIAPRPGDTLSDGSGLHGHEAQPVAALTGTGDPGQDWTGTASLLGESCWSTPRGSDRTSNKRILAH